MPSTGRGKMSPDVVVWRCQRCGEETVVPRTGRNGRTKLPGTYSWKWNRYGRVEHKCLSGVWSVCTPWIDFPRYLVVPGRVRGRFMNSMQIVRMYDVPLYECLILPPHKRRKETIDRLVKAGLVVLGAADGMAMELGHVGQLELELGA